MMNWSNRHRALMNRMNCTTGVWLCAFVFCGAAFCGLSGRLQAKDVFLTIGGGYSPVGNQVSLERNVQFLQHVLSEQKPGVAHDIFFSDGASPDRDIQFRPAPDEIPRVNELLALIFDQNKTFGFKYRTHELEGVTGATTKVNLTKWFDQVGSNLKAQDRLFIYVTAHGGKGSEKNSHNTSIYLWNMQRMQMTELAQMLDKVPSEVDVVMVMVQCYAGGFANLIFEQGNSNGGLAKANRIGFFATVDNRVSAGCTPQVNEVDYQEYSSFFWSALRGRTRTGSSIELPDYDGDRKISFAEAHAYALLVSDTIDVPIRASGLLLRTYSKIKESGNPGLVTPNSSYTHLISLADPIDRAVMVGLSDQLELVRDDRARETRELVDELTRQIQQVDVLRKKIAKQYIQSRIQIRRAILLRWPELNNPWNPRNADWWMTESTAIVSAIESHSQYSRMERLRGDRERLADLRRELDLRRVKCFRLLRTIENVALSANLDKVSSEEIQNRYRKMIDLERRFLSDAKNAGRLTEPSDVKKENGAGKNAGQPTRSIVLPIS